MAQALARGFADPVLDAQRTFRAVMEALARPGRLQALETNLAPPEPLTPELAAVALTLADHEAPLWLDPALAAESAVAAYLRFHTGAAITADSREAAFALVADASRMPPLANFALGTLEYPDRSTTVIVAVESLSGKGGWRLRGPGIDGSAMLSAVPLRDGFAEELRANHARFPQGVDLLFVAPGRAAGLPRSTALIGEA
ncbi:MAG TPA: phosphonate C-P lyase system protein PhnH [Beijerinckiaceae bacterium]|jgi:alpha-D-ribose 1-methylphosphonate 5-triphosphate synthase subunit PhnH